MADPKHPEIAKTIAAARSDKFSLVTTAGNKAATVISKALDQDANAIVESIRKAMPEVLQTVVEVTFEKAKAWAHIEGNENLRYYTNLDYDSWMNPGECLNRSDLKQATVSSYFEPRVNFELISSFREKIIVFMRLISLI